MTARDHAALSEAAARDLRRACIHEYAHWAVARDLGAAGFVTITGGHGASSDGPRFGGRFQMHGDLAEDEWRIVALAGAIAECFDGDRDIDAHAILRNLMQGDIMLSGSDAVLAAGHDERDVVQCLLIVKRRWREIEADAAAFLESIRE